MGRILGIDPGTRRSGVAISDDKAVMALPLTTIESSRDELAQRLAELARDLNAVEVVIGLPKRLSGQEGSEAQDARRLAARLGKLIDAPVHMFDERLTTVGAQRIFKQTGLKTRKQKPVVDQVAATLLLQGFLDARIRAGKGE